MTKTLYLMRHAETLFNLQGKTQGWCDSPLTPRGIEQARLTGEEFARRGISVDHAYCSTAERCSDTLELVCTAAYGAPLPYERRKGLREINFGTYEAMDQFLEAHDDDFATFYAAFGGETQEEAVNRLSDDLTTIMERPDNQSVIVCSHGGIAISFYMHWKEHAKVPPTIFSNCMTYVYTYEDGIFSCQDMFVADLSSLEQPGMPKQVKTIDISKPPTL